MFLTGARLFFGSLEAGMYLLGSITGIPEGVHVLPVISGNFSHHISAGLADGSVIVGQNAISHPSAPTALPAKGGVADGHAQDMMFEDISDANLPGSLPTLRQQNITFSKDVEEALPSRIQRIWYINPYGQEIRPSANPKVIEALKNAQCVLYSIGSLYTSIVPCLILRGVGQELLSPHIRFKILILNGSLDRETGPIPFTATDFITAIAQACAESRNLHEKPSPEEYKVYVTHLIHLDGEGTPKVDTEYLKNLGIRCVRVYGRRAEDRKGMRYDGRGLMQALEVILGKKDGGTEKTRRMSLEA